MEIGQHGDAEVAVHAQQGIHHHLGVARVERGDRLVGEDDARLLDQGAGDGDALLLAARQGAGAVGGEAADVEELQRRERDRLVVGGPQLEQGAPFGRVVEPAHQHVGEHVEAVDQGELLEHHGAVAAPVAQRRALQRGDVAVLEDDAAVARLDQAVDHAQERRLAGAGAADDADHLAGGDFQVDRVDGDEVTEAAGETLDREHARLLAGHAWRAGSRGWRRERPKRCSMVLA